MESPPAGSTPARRSWRSTPEGACLLFLLGFAALFAQYIYIVRVAEVYPSISLPRGASIVRDGVMPINARWLLFALTADDRRLPVDEHELLSTVPGQYRTPILQRRFGLDPGSRARAEHVHEARAWLRSRLAEQLPGEDVIALELVRALQLPRAAPASYRALEIHRVEL